MTQGYTATGQKKIDLGVQYPTLPAWAFKNRLTESVVVATDYTDVTGPVLTLETGVFVTLQSNAYLIITG